MDRPNPPFEAVKARGETSSFAHSGHMANAARRHPALHPSRVPPSAGPRAPPGQIQAGSAGDRCLHCDRPAVHQPPGRAPMPCETSHSARGAENPSVSAQFVRDKFECRENYPYECSRDRPSHRSNHRRSRRTSSSCSANHHPPLAHSGHRSAHPPRFAGCAEASSTVWFFPSGPPCATAFPRLPWSWRICSTAVPNRQLH